MSCMNYTSSLSDGSVSPDELTRKCFIFLNDHELGINEAEIEAVKSCRIGVSVMTIPWRYYNIRIQCDDFTILLHSEKIEEETNFLKSCPTT